MKLLESGQHVKQTMHDSGKQKVLDINQFEKEQLSRNNQSGKQVVSGDGQSGRPKTLELGQSDTKKHPKGITDGGDNDSASKPLPPIPLLDGVVDNKLA